VSLTAAIAGLRQQPIAEVLALLEQARSSGRTVFIFGNGGSAATAMHMACDLGKNTRSPGTPLLRVVCLNDNVATLSAFGNDEGYESVFAEPLRALARPADIAIAVSASGNSPNIIRAVEAARDLEMTIIGLTGVAGGRLAGLVDICLRADAVSLEQIEDIHIVVNHLLTVLLRGYGEPFLPASP
jgi:D-sedoheptulose 7-phosphate isomerase